MVFVANIEKREFFSQLGKLSEDEIKINITTFIVDLLVGQATYWPNSGTRFTYFQWLFEIYNRFTIHFLLLRKLISTFIIV